MPDVVPDPDLVRREVRSPGSGARLGLGGSRWSTGGTRLVSAGWAAPSWPRRWFGRDLPAWADEVTAAELLDAGAPGVPVGSAFGLAAPTILAHGPDAMCERFLRPILTGEESWCQLFSEPGAGSDLAGLTTRADPGRRRVGDQCGQKVWNTSAHHADLAMLVARTRLGAAQAQRADLLLLCLMHQPGAEALGLFGK